GLRRQIAANLGTLTTGSLQSSTQRSTLAVASTFQMAQKFQPRHSLISRRMSGAAALNVSDSARVCVTMYCTAKRRSARLRKVMSREMPNVPTMFPVLSRRHCLVVETQVVEPSGH